MFQVKEDKTSGKDFNATEISNISDKEFKLMVINVFTKVRWRMYEHNENINKEKTGKYQTEVTELKNKIHVSRLDEVEEWIKNLEDRALEIILKEQ